MNGWVTHFWLVWFWHVLATLEHSTCVKP